MNNFIIRTAFNLQRYFRTRAHEPARGYGKLRSTVTVFDHSQIYEAPMKNLRSLIFLLVVSSLAGLFQTASLAKSSEQEPGRRVNRDTWQRPEEVMDGLGAAPGHQVADIGCGSGYFTFHLAKRVGVEGKVYAIDVDRAALKKVKERKQRENLAQVEPILGEDSDPRLPQNIDSVLIVDTYHEIRDYERMMQAVFNALKPGGRLVIIDGEGPSGKPRKEYHRLHVIPAEIVRVEVARSGFVFKENREGFYDAEYGKRMYFLIFEKPDSGKATKRQDGNECS